MANHLLINFKNLLILILKIAEIFIWVFPKILFVSKKYVFQYPVTIIIL